MTNGIDAMRDFEHARYVPRNFRTQEGVLIIGKPQDMDRNEFRGGEDLVIAPNVENITTGDIQAIVREGVFGFEPVVGDVEVPEGSTKSNIEMIAMPDYILITPSYLAGLALRGVLIKHPVSVAA